MCQSSRRDRKNSDSVVRQFQRYGWPRDNCYGTSGRGIVLYQCFNNVIHFHACFYLCHVGYYRKNGNNLCSITKFIHIFICIISMNVW